MPASSADAVERPDLSIVIPAWNEAGKIGRDVRAATDFLRAQHLRGEIIVVDDGSTDGTAEEAEKPEIPPEVTRRVIRVSRHRGKGFAVRIGICRSLGRFVLFADSGLCIPFETALAGLELLQTGLCDIAHGSRHLPESRIVRPHRLHRRIFSWAFRRVVLPLLGIHGLTDTQCGFKIYRGGPARMLYARCRSNGFEFDIEVILRALHAGLRICEFPVEWRSDRDSRFPSLSGPFRCALALARLRVSLTGGADDALERPDDERADANDDRQA